MLTDKIAIRLRGKTHGASKVEGNFSFARMLLCFSFGARLFRKSCPCILTLRLTIQVDAVMKCSSPPLRQQRLMRAVVDAGRTAPQRRDFFSADTNTIPLTRNNAGSRTLTTGLAANNALAGFHTYVRRTGMGLSLAAGARRIINGYAHAHRRAPPGRNPGGGRKRQPD